MRPEAKKKGGMMFGGKKRGMPAALNKGKTNHGKMAKGGHVKKMAMGGLGAGMGASAPMTPDIQQQVNFARSSEGMSPISGVMNVPAGARTMMPGGFTGGGFNQQQPPMGRMGRPNMGGMQGGQSGGMQAMAKGGKVGYSKMEKEHVSAMKKHGVPKKFIKQEEKEAEEETGMKKGGKVKPNFAKMFGNKMKPPGMNMGGMAGYKKGGMACGGKMKYAEGGTVKKPYVPTAGDLNEKSGGDQEFENRKYMEEQRKKAKPAAPAPKPKMYARGGGVESKGKGAGTMVKMASGGSVSARADGIASKGKTNCKVC